MNVVQNLEPYEKQYMDILTYITAFFKYKAVNEHKIVSGGDI